MLTIEIFNWDCNFINIAEATVPGVQVNNEAFTNILSLDL